MSYQYDHRQLADEMEIYFLNDEIGAGLPVWLPNGMAIREQLESYIKEIERKLGYQRVASPHVGRFELYEKSGHLRHFGENMFPPMQRDGATYYLRPMNCPHHHKVFKELQRSYRNLPLRIAEYGQIYRFENSGSLRGLSRVRGICQNDAHIYVEKKRALDEILNVLDLHEYCYRQLGISGYRYRLSIHDPSRPEDFQGGLEKWNEAESILKIALEQKGLNFFEGMGEAAFYGPKIDVQMKMGVNKQEESIASLQLDVLSGERFDLRYVSQSGELEFPWIIHRAPLGSHERFIAMLLEYFDGQLPAWLSPLQVFLIPVSEKDLSKCLDLKQDLINAGLRCYVDQSQGSLAKRIHFAHRYRPFSKIVVGAKELNTGVFQLQWREGESKLEWSDVVDFLKELCLMPS